MMIQDVPAQTQQQQIIAPLLQISLCVQNVNIPSIGDGSTGTNASAGAYRV